MKWKNKGHEVDYMAKALADEYRKNEKIYIFGAGTLGGELQLLLKKYDCFGGFVDNNKRKQEDGFLGEKVISLEDYLMKAADCWLVVAATQKNMDIISEQLLERGLVKGKHFFLFHDFKDRIFPILATYYYNQTFVSLAQITLTERCSLRCRKCAHGCFAVDSTAKDLELEKVYQSADVFFDRVDYAQEFVLIGGEPLLYKELGNAILYIGKRYRNKMSIFSITTNGTILPSDEIIEACKQYGVLFRISNYSVQIPRLLDCYDRLIKVLEKNNITYVLGKAEHEWMDYGFGSTNRQVSEKKLIEVFDACKTPCREIRGNKFYFCVMARSVSDNLHYGIGMEDYLDLEELDGEDARKVFLEYTLGYSHKGYLDMCNYCNGAEAMNYPIPAAEQVSVDKGEIYE